MIRFKVVRASRLLLCAAIFVLIVTAGIILVRYAAGSVRQPDTASVSLVAARHDEAKAQAAFAFSSGSADPLRIGAVPPIEIEVVEDAGIPPQSEAPSVLIYHTHTHEAYEQVAEDPYEAVEAWRTADADHSVVRVGEVLAECLKERGFDVVHDATDHETGPLSSAYSRSLETLEGYAQTFDLYIDLHRDAYSAGMDARFIGADGTAYAQPMVLIGNGSGFDEKPYFEQNLAFAKLLTERINRRCPGLCRDVLVKDGRYNQHIGIFSILIEVGHNRNTLVEALHTTPVIADALCSLMIDEPNPGIQVLKDQESEY